MHVEIDQSEWSVRNYTLNTIKLDDLPLEYKDDDYINDMKYLRTLADEARDNDLVVGTSGFMPMTTSIIRSDLRMCMGGECSIGNIFTDALRWAGDVDFVCCLVEGFEVRVGLLVRFMLVIYGQHCHSSTICALGP